MSGILGIGGGGGDTEFYPYTLDQSVRFNDGDSGYFIRTPASDGNLDSWTFSAWTKLANADNGRYLLGASIATSKWFHIAVNTSGQIDIRQFNGASYDFRKITDAVLRDVSAWYHIVVSYDSANATAEDRIKVYLNGERVTSFGTNTNPSSGLDSYVNQNHAHTIGAFVNNNGSSFSNYYDGYLAEVNLVDGTTLLPTSFGETKAGIWVPIEYTGSYGTNGFYLNFKDDIVSEGFNTVTYQGKGATQSISGLGFSPDLVWIKSRTSSSQGHRVIDTVRGAPLTLKTHTTDAEYNDTTALTSFDADGFTLGSLADVNGSGNSYVAWAWDAGTGSAASNTDGSITSTVKANPSYGFSIVSYTGNGTDGASVGHGLSGVDFLIIKDRDNVRSWMVHSSASGFTDTDYLYFDTTDYKGRYGATSFLNGAPSSTVINLGNHAATNGSTTNYIAYCFEEVSGYSKIGSYTGTGASGNTVSCGFRPAFLMVKRTDSAQSWFIVDNTREPDDSAAKTLELSPNVADAEPTYGSGDVATFTSTGFELAVGNLNLSGGTYIFMAFADTRDYAFWKDQSSNGNHFTPENLQYTDTLKDTPTNNFATWNTLRNGANVALSEGNLKAVTSATVAQSAVGTIGMSSGKWYWEVRNEGGSLSYTGIVDEGHAPSTYIGSSSTGNGYAYNTGGQKVGPTSGTTATYGATYTTGDIIGVALDMDAGTIDFYKNNSSQGEAFSGLTGTWFPAVSGNGVAGKGGFVNFGQDSSFSGLEVPQGNTDGNGIGDFYYAPPSGFLALCAANLPAPAIDPNAGQTPTDYFNTVTYTGVGGQSITGVGFQPDFVWIKSRSASRDHKATDVVRGVNKELVPNETFTESTRTTGLTSFDSDGFTVGSESGYDNSGDNFVAWNWKAGGTAVSNTDGSITSSVSASPESGFSIVTYTGTGANATVGHGLSKAPDMIILKKRTNDTQAWQVYHSGNTSAPETDKLTLNTTAATVDDNTTWNDTAPTSTVFSIGTGSGTNENTDTYVAYCFANTDGMVKAGSYTGNNSTTFVYTGFRPAFVMIKSSNQTRNWITFDNKRTPTNQMDGHLHPSANIAEQTGTDEIDFLSNGFNLRSPDNDTNTSAFEYVYLAFAEQPFKYANAR